MEIAVFGTGYVFEKYRGMIPCNICCLIDNAQEKQGNEIDGIRIIAPAELAYYHYTYVVIMTFGYEEIERQLIEMGIQKEKILNYSQISSIQDTYPKVHTDGDMESLEEWLDRNEERKKLLLVSHDFSYTGVPVAVMNMALVLKKMEYAVMMAGLTGGNLTKEIAKNGIDYLEELNVCYGTEWFGKAAEEFDYIVAGTLVLNKFVRRCSVLSVRILWWLHESDCTLYNGIELSWLSGNIKIFGVGSRVIRCFRMHYADIDAGVGQLHYCLSKADSTEHKADTADTDNGVIFAVIGQISYRKAQDIVLDAMRRISYAYKGRFQCMIIGASSGIEQEYCNKILKEAAHIKEAKVLGELDQEQIEKIYAKTDVLLCPSRDDPMPITVTQAMMHGKACIVSENVGQSEYIRQGENGFIFKNERTDELAGYMAWAIEHKKQLYQIGECSRQIYENEFSAKLMEKDIRNIFENWDES